MPGFPGCASSASASAPRVHFWPFDGWDIPAGRSAIAEVYPALWSRGFANEGRTGDQHDAFSIAAWLSRADRDGGCGANAGDRRKKALGSLTRITRQALHSKSQARFCF